MPDLGERDPRPPIGSSSPLTARPASSPARAPPPDHFALTAPPPSAPLPPSPPDSLRRKRRAPGGAAAAPPHAARALSFQSLTLSSFARRAPPAAATAAAAAAADGEEGEEVEEGEEGEGEEGEEQEGAGEAAAKRPRLSRLARLRLQKGLRHFSLKVCEKVEGKQVTTYNEVAESLVKELAGRPDTDAPGKRAYDEKNIRRRVYDALNVLYAMGIIAKDKKAIQWVGLPGSEGAELEELQARLAAKQADVAAKREALVDMLREVVSLHNLFARNARAPAAEAPRLALPFVLARVPGGARVECRMSQDRREVDFAVSAPFSVHEHRDVLRELGLADAEPFDLARMVPRELAHIYAAADARAPRQGVS